MDLWQDVQRRLAVLDRAVSEMRKRGEDFANAEAEYQSAKATAALRMASEGTPVTLISAAVKGLPEVNRKLVERECARALYESVREGINTEKLAIRVLEQQLEREWSQAGRM